MLTLGVLENEEKQEAAKILTIATFTGAFRTGTLIGGLVVFVLSTVVYVIALSL